MHGARAGLGGVPFSCMWEWVTLDWAVEESSQVNPESVNSLVLSFSGRQYGLGVVSV